MLDPTSREAEAAALDAQIEALVRVKAPELLALPSVGPQIAATMLFTLGDKPQRIGTERAFAKLCGVAPIDASSGQQIRHRLNRGGKPTGQAGPPHHGDPAPPTS